MLKEAWEYEDNFPMEMVLDEKSTIKHLTHFDGDLTVETWLMANGLVINFLMGRFGNTIKDIKAKWGYANVQEAIQDSSALVK